jgi:methyltransferase
MVSSRVIYFSFLGLLACERGLELAISRRNARLAFARGAVEVGHRHFRAMATFHTLFFFSCIAEVLVLARPFPGLIGIAAYVGAIGAQGLRYWTIFTLKERWSVRVIVFPNAAPVTSGPFRFIRHPNYLAVICEMFCVPVAHGAWITALVFSVANASLLATRIRIEESALGNQYAEAFAHRPRFLPRFFRDASH